MTHFIRKRLFASSVCVLAYGYTCIAFAGGAIAVSPQGKPVTWPNGGRDVVIYTDAGGLGPMTNADAVAQTNTALSRWNAVSDSTARYRNGGSLGVDVDVSNFVPYLDGTLTSQNQVIYDADGAIFELIFGPGNVIFGFSGDDTDASGTRFAHGAVFLNGGAIDVYPGLTAAEFLATQVHEFGHMLGLDHSVVNGELATSGDATGPTPFNTFARPASFDGVVETMYPFLLPGAGQDSPEIDDRAALAALYPTNGFRTRAGTIAGRILDIDGRTPLSGVNVIARNIGDPFGDAVSDISGRFAAGEYVLNGLTPGAKYAVFIDQILFGSFSVSPTVLPAGEEFFNGPRESDNFNHVDPPNEFQPVTTSAGKTRSGVDIVLNRLRPGPISLTEIVQRELIVPTIPVLLPFSFEMCGRKYDRTILDVANGWVSFGVVDDGFIFSGWTRAFLEGSAPKIAALTTALNPDPQSDLITFEQTNDSVSVRYVKVPEIRIDGTTGGENTFAITLMAKTPQHRNRARLSYGHLDARSGIAGYACGNLVPSKYEQEIDLSAHSGQLIDGDGKAAVFEEFGNLDNDLQGRTVTFEMPRGFSDEFEPNNSLVKARLVELPFDTAYRYADLHANDVDNYRFWARAGETLVAETVPGHFIDTQIDLFDERGTRVATNDDILQFDLYSRVIYTVPKSGFYTAGVSLGPTGDKFPGLIAPDGRYVLTINSYKGTVLPMGDDTSVNVPLRFAFPFQGRNWRSAWVNSNGSVTFGAPETVSVIADMQLPGFLAGPPRIAPFFTDLDPTGSFNGGVTGLVIADQDADSLTVNWVSVAKFFDTDTNTATVKLKADGSIKMSWGAALGEDLDLRGTIVGVTPGMGTADPGPSDLSLMGRMSRSGITYEQYSTGLIFGPSGVPEVTIAIPSFDLSFDRLRFADRDD